MLDRRHSPAGVCSDLMVSAQDLGHELSLSAQALNSKALVLGRICGQGGLSIASAWSSQSCGLIPAFAPGFMTRMTLRQ